jgi:hypothetical protein
MKYTVITAKLVPLLRRYLLAEIIGTITALTGAFCVHHATGSLVTAAIAGSIAESIGFYSYFATRNGIRYYRHHHAHSSAKRVLLTMSHTVRDMIIEFGPAEVIDSLLVRPFFMYLGPTYLGNFGGGLLAGKLAADLVFYILAACGNELKKYWHKKIGSTLPND